MIKKNISFVAVYANIAYAALELWQPVFAPVMFYVFFFPDSDCEICLRSLATPIVRPSESNSLITSTIWYTRSVCTHTHIGPWGISPPPSHRHFPSDAGHNRFIHPFCPPCQRFRAEKRQNKTQGAYKHGNSIPTPRPLVHLYDRRARTVCESSG